MARNNKSSARRRFWRFYYLFKPLFSLGFAYFVQYKLLLKISAAPKMDSLRDDGNVIHIIGGDDKPVSATGYEYDKASANKSIAIQKLLFKTKWCVEFRSGTCQNATNCNFAHRSSELRSLQQNYDDFGLANEHKYLLNTLRESFPQFGTYIDRSLKHCKKFYSEEGCPLGDGCPYVHDLVSKYRERTAIVVSGGRSSSVKRDGRVTAAPPAWPQSAAPTSPVAEADATVKPPNWRTRICMKWENSGHCQYGSRCYFAHGEAELRRYGGALVNPINQEFNAPNTVAAPGSSVAVAGGAAQLQGAEQRSVQTTWKFPKKTNGIYGDWIDDIE